jgi:hypothetical protein
MLSDAPTTTVPLYYESSGPCSICAKCDQLGLQALADRPSRGVFVCKGCVELGQICVHCKSIVGKDDEHFLRWVPGKQQRSSAGRLFALCSGCTGSARQAIATLLSWP